MTKFMFRFFQNIRKSLLFKAGFRKYLAYSLGEMLLVVAGILIALQVNNWNNAAKERNTEVALLLQLEKDLTASLNDIRYNIRLHEQGIRSAEIIQAHMQDDHPYTDSIASHLASSFPWTRLVINAGAYETIKSHGIELISNVELRDGIVDLFEGRLYFQRELESITQEYSEYMRREGAVPFFEASHVDFGVRHRYDLGRSVPIDYETLKEDVTFLYHLETHKHLVHTLQKAGNRPMQARIERLIEMIQDELSNA